MSKESVERAEENLQRYQEAREKKEQELDDHMDFKNGQPRTPAEIDAHIAKQDQLEAELDKARQEEKEAQEILDKERAQQAEVESVQERNTQEELGNGGYSQEEKDEMQSK
ncbi:MAG: hypothetical protein IKB99_04175, partial [Lentisphaeria bacterium]|nr:hypothetical protein [Lentisphaeria bacterium]